MSTDRPIDVNEVPNDRKKRPDVSIFSYECVVAATNNFSLESKLGEGGFGSVYMVSSKTFLRRDGQINFFLIVTKQYLIITIGNTVNWSKSSSKAAIKKFRARNN